MELLSDKLRESNQKLIEMQGQQDTVTSSLDSAQLKIQDLTQELAADRKRVSVQHCLMLSELVTVVSNDY